MVAGVEFAFADVCKLCGWCQDFVCPFQKIFLADVLQSDYSEVITVGAGADSVDFKLVSICQKGDFVVTQDYGVAAMILGKGAYGIHQSGKWYTNKNIDQMLMERHMAKKARNAKKKHHLKGPAKRTAEDDQHFEDSLRRLIDSIKSE